MAASNRRWWMILSGPTAVGLALFVTLSCGQQPAAPPSAPAATVPLAPVAPPVSVSPPPPPVPAPAAIPQPATVFHAVVPPATPSIPDGAAAAPDANVNESLSTLIQRLVTDSLPRQFDDHKDWDKKTKVVTAVRIQNNDGHLKLDTHKKEVKNGFWKRYDAKLIDQPLGLQVWVANMHASGPGRTSLQLFLVAKLDGQARLEQWKDGVKLFNCASEAVCLVQARLDFDIVWRWAPGSIVGELIVEPKVTGAQLTLEQFDLKKVGVLEGWAARELGDGLNGLVAKELHHQEPKLVEKLNAQIAKKQNRLNFSPDTVLTEGWSKLQSFLGVNTPTPAGMLTSTGSKVPPPPLPATD